MAGPINKMPQGLLPEGYEYVGDITYINSESLIKDLQFRASFEATGKLYFNQDNPDSVYICINTYWLENAYVKLSKKL